MFVSRLRASLSLSAIAGLTIAMSAVAMAPAHADDTTRQLQWNLAGLGYLPMSGIDGTMGPNTTSAIEHFQGDQCLAVDGIAGVKTNGDLVKEVSLVQDAANVTADGAFGPNTKAAVATWQSTHRLSADGIAGAQTEAGMQIIRVRECNVGSSTPLPTSSATAQAQWDLAGLGYLPWSGIDGQVGPQTTAAIEAFQNDHCLASDGVLGSQTNAALATIIKQVQSKTGASATGGFNAATRSAVAAWQRSHSLNADGQAGPDTMRGLGISRSGSCTPRPTPPITGTQGADIPQLARTELGNSARNHEVNGYNCNFYSASLGRGATCAGGYRSEAWCADFAGWVWLHADVNTAGLNAGAASFWDYGQRFNTKHSTPKVGDAVVYGYDKNNGYAQHVGLVVAVDGSSYTVIAGNAGPHDNEVHESTGHVGSGGVSAFISPIAKG